MKRLHLNLPFLKPVHLFVILGIALLSSVVATPLLADVTLPTVLDNHMVLQRNKPIKIWGWADAKEEVTVNFGDNSEKTTADENGDWSVEFPAMTADGKSHSLTVQATNKIELKDILIGDVWVGSGQSNMEWSLKNTQNSKEAIAAAEFANVRLFHIPKVRANAPAKNVKAKWKACTPANIPNFSAVLYYFGKKLHEEKKVPIGLINSSWGGSPIEPWTVTDKGSGAMYNGMIAPIQNYSVRGVIWYQGETNVLQKNGLAYFGKMKDLIEGWRKIWRDETMPFYYVQIAPWSGRYEPGQLPALWEAQVATLKIPHTGMAVTTDLVDKLNDIHPRNKKDVGERLARWALAKSYQTDGVIYSGPLYKSMKVVKNQIHIEFAHVGTGLKSRDGKPLSEFKVAGEDGKFVDATAKIEGDKVVVSSDTIAEPKQVQFGWHKTTNPNLVNSEGLPASPFQTNNWTGGTGVSSHADGEAKTDEQANIGGLKSLVGENSPLRSGEKIAFYGDSVTMQGGYITQLRDALKKDKKTKSLNVQLLKHGLNGGRVPTVLEGKSPWGNLGGSMKSLLEKEKASIVVIYLGINDVWHGEKGTKLIDFQSGMASMIEMARKNKATIVLCTPTIIGEEIKDNKMNETLGIYAKAIKKLAKQESLVVCDLHSAFLTQLKKVNTDNKHQGNLTYDGVHMNEKGNQLIANQIADSIAVAIRNSH